MPYFVFEIRSFGRYRSVAGHAVFAEASRQAKALRAGPGLEPGTQFKIVFAPDEAQAVDLLCEPRTARPGDDE